MPVLELVHVDSSSELRWYRDNQSLDPPIPLTDEVRAELGAVEKAFDSLFAGQHGYVDPDELRGLGRRLYDRLLAPVWPQLKVGSNRELLLRSDDPRLLNLPLELIEAPDSNGVPIGCDSRWAILRVPLDAPAVEPATEPAPLRLLVSISAPTNQKLLRYEHEEDLLVRVTSRLGQNVALLPFTETGGVDELERLVADQRYRPHVVHLSGHGILKDGHGYFAFEDERGHTHLCRADDLGRQVFLGSSVRCVVLSACHAGEAAAGGLPGQMVKSGVPLVLGWGAAVGDDAATAFGTVFYEYLGRRLEVPAAAAKARDTIWRDRRLKKGGHEFWDPTFALARLFAAGPNVGLIDRKLPVQAYEGPKSVRELLDDDIKGLREGLIGRRRIQQQLIPALRDGDLVFVVLYGFGGAGKSTLATRMASRLREAGYEAFGAKAEQRVTPAEAGQWFLHNKLLPALARPFVEAEPSLFERISDGKLPVPERIRLAVREWNKRKLLLVIDNFEDVLDLATRTIADPELLEAYRILARDLGGQARAIVTCRFEVASTPARPGVLQRELDDLSHPEFLRFLRQDPTVDRRYLAGEIPAAMIESLFRTFGGLPGYLDLVRGYLETADLSDWDADEPEWNDLEEKRQKYCEERILPRLYELLPELARQVASRLAISELPIPVEALTETVAGLTTDIAEAAQQAARYGLVQKFEDPAGPLLFHVPGLIGKWLSGDSRLSPEEAIQTHARLARFWKSAFDADRENELRVTFDSELWACRVHALAGNVIPELNWSSTRLANRLERISRWQEARELLDEIRPEHRDAGTLHALATIDVRQGRYPEARAGFEQSLVIRRELKDRAGEGATIYQLGFVAWKMGRKREALPLVALAFQILQVIGSGDAKVALKNLAAMCSELEFTEDQIAELQRTTAEAYQQDRDDRLIREAFGE